MAPNPTIAKAALYISMADRQTDKHNIQTRTDSVCWATCGCKDVVADRQARDAGPGVGRTCM